MKWFVYNVLFAVGYTLMLPKFLLRMLKRGGYGKGFMQRLAKYDDETLEKLRTKRRVWVHAVSVGEIYVALNFVKRMREVNPSLSFVISTTTSTGHRVASDGMEPEDVLIYFPADFPGVVRRVLDIVNPLVLILTECELWPNIIRTASKRNVPVMMINGRISDSSYRGYKKLKTFFGDVLSCFSIILVQTDEDSRKLREAGAEEKSIVVVGSSKFDIAMPDNSEQEKAGGLLKKAGMKEDDLILVGGSTWSGEEKILLEIYARLKKKHNSLKLVLVPRHAERRDEVEREISKTGLVHVRRSALDDGSKDFVSTPDIFLVDTTGELMNFYSRASVIFVGKSLTVHGGQNIIEPAMFGKPVVVGPNLENFAEAAELFLKEDAIIQVDDASGLENKLDALLASDSMRASLGERARKVVDKNRGAVGRSVEMIMKFIPRS